MKKVEALLCEYASFVKQDRIAKQELDLLTKVALAISGNVPSAQKRETMKKSKRQLEWGAIDLAVDLIAIQITEDDWKPRKICGVSRGGLVPGVMLSHLLNVPFEPITPSTILLDSKDVLIVDDIYDSGATIKQLKRLNPNVRTAVVLFNDQHDVYEVDYYGDDYCGEQWIVFPWESYLS
jgi:hypoxanthine phosphoribosyltransferase